MSTISDIKEKRLPGIDLTLSKSTRTPSAHHPSGFVMEFIFKGIPDKNPSYEMPQEEVFEKIIRLLSVGTRVYAVEDLPTELLSVLREDNEKLAAEKAELEKQLILAKAEAAGYRDQLSQVNGALGPLLSMGMK